MLTKKNIYDNVTNRINQINEEFNKNDVRYFLYKKGSFFEKVTTDTAYITDIDFSFNIQIQENKKDIYGAIRNTIDFIYGLEKANLIKIKTVADKRFDFNLGFNENGSPKNYDPSHIREKISEYHKSGIITEKEFNYISRHIKDNPDIVTYFLLIDTLEDFQSIDWTYDEFKSGQKDYRKKTFVYYDIFYSFPTITKWIYETQNDKYIMLDCSFHTYTISNRYKNAEINDYYIYNTFRKHSIQNEKKIIYSMLAYEQFFKYYSLKRYFKALRRLGGLIRTYMYSHEKPVNKKRRKILHGVSKRIFKFSKNERIRCLNQLKIQIDIILGLFEYKTELEIKKMMVQLIRNSLEICKYDINKNTVNVYNALKNKFNKNKIKDLLNVYKKSIQDEINKIAYPEIRDIYEKIHIYLPFKLSFET